MLDLAENNIWKELSSCGDSAEIPMLLQQCLQNPTKEVLEEICYYQIYCQDTLYQTTFAAFPYLIKILEQLKNSNTKLCFEYILNLGSILCNLDNKDEYFKQIMSSSTVKKEIVDDIVDSYNSAFARFHKIVYSFTDYSKDQDEYSKKWFVVALAVANRHYEEGNILNYFTDEECACSCDFCDAELYIELDDESEEYVISEDGEEYFSIIPAVPVKPVTEPEMNNLFEWFTYYTGFLNSESLKKGVRYLFGEFECPVCQKKNNVFKAIHNYLY